MRGLGGSGRSSDFIWLGGFKRITVTLKRRFPAEENAAWEALEHAAVDHVEQVLTDGGIHPAKHSEEDIAGR